MCGLAKGSCSIIIVVINIWRRRVDVLLSGICLTAGICAPQLPALGSKKPRTDALLCIPISTSVGDTAGSNGMNSVRFHAVCRIYAPVDSFENPIFRSYNVRGVCIYHIVYYMYIYLPSVLRLLRLFVPVKWLAGGRLEWNGGRTGFFVFGASVRANRRRNGGHIK